MTPLEARILALVEQGQHQQAAELLVSSFGDAVYAYCHRETGDAATAQELAQTTFIVAARSLRSFRRQSELKTWLIGIARHRVLEHVRNVQHSDRVIAQLQRYAHSEPVAVDGGQQLERTELRMELEDCVRRLNVEQREAVTLHVIYGISFVDMVEMIGEKADTLRKRCERGLLALRECLTGKGLWRD